MNSGIYATEKKMSRGTWNLSLLIIPMLTLLGSNTRNIFIPQIAGSGFVPAFVTSFVLILGSEIGDKTFFIAAILSMKHSPVVVFTGAISALFVMTVLSTGMGVILPSLLSKEITHYACICLFVVFGVRLLHDVFTSEDDQTEESDELKEVEMEIAQREGHASPSSTRSSRIRSHDSKQNHSSTSVITSIKEWFNSSESRRIAIQSFVMTFLAEWGDRSQIATIALASSKDPVGVTAGGVVGHCLCTGLAVIGGRLLASRISEKHVNLAGGCMFIFFALASLIMGVDSDE